jgi:putative membrane-bound dehydrogenase-like protein
VKLAEVPLAAMKSTTPLPRVLTAAVSFLLLATSGPAAEFKFGDKTFTVPDGYTVERIAAAPLVDRPIAVAFDEQGRMYATDSAGMTDKADKQLAAKPHRIRRLVDTDGDGAFDTSTIFADKLMFPEGCLWHEGSLYVAAPPELWKFTDTDDDGIADRREVWHDGKTVTGCANDAHGPYLGRDGWFYWTKGAFAEQNYTLPNGKPFKTRASHIFRARPDHSGLEPVLTGGMDNPVNVTFLSTGERILSCTFFQYPAAGRRDGLIHAIYGGVYGKTHDSIYEHTMTGEVMPVLTHMGAAAPCGLIAGSASLFGGGQRDTLFACYFNLHQVARHELVPNGATFTTRDMVFFASDHPDVHPTDVLEDADGSLIVVDTGGWYKVCCPTSQLAKPDVLGAIYRVRKVGAPKPADPRGLKIAWAKQSSADLARLLDDPRHYVQQRAIAQLGKLGGQAVATLAKVPGGKGSTTAKQNAIWALTRIEGKAAREAVSTAVFSQDIEVRLAAIHSAGLWRDAGALAPLRYSLSRDNGPAARAAAEALGRIGDKSAVPLLLGAAERLPQIENTDARRVLEHSLIYALIEIGDTTAIREELTRVLPAARQKLVLNTTGGANDTAASLWRAALVALDQIGGNELKPEEVAALRHSAHADLRETAFWIASHRPEVGDRLALSYYGDLLFDSLPRPDLATTSAQLARLAGSKAIQDTLCKLLTEPDVPRLSRRIAVRAMTLARLKETPAAWIEVLNRMLGGDDFEVVAEAVTAVRALNLPKQGTKGLFLTLQDVGADRDVPADTRLDALAIAGTPASVDKPLFDFLLASVAPEQPHLSRTAAANILAKAKLSPAQQLALAEHARRVGPLELPRLLPAFERGANEELGLKLVAALGESAGVSGLRVDLLKPLFAKYPPAVQEAGQKLITRFNADEAAQAAQLGKLVEELRGGDVRRGHLVFLSAKAACYSCHKLGHGGGTLGPDLTNIGKVRTERDLIEAIVFPNASFVRGYEPFTVATKGGEDFTGIIRNDAPDEIVLAVGPQLEQRIPRADVTELRPSAVSLMPAGLDAVLTKQELADLVAFLKNVQR